MEQHNSNFTIKPSNVAGALASIKGLAGNETITDGSGRHYSWVISSEFVNAETLSQALRAWRWVCVRDGETNEIEGINFEGEKIGDEEALFDAIAPFVEPGSFLEMQGEDGALWRWVFDGKTCTEKTATVSWD
jgi:hypothetical protein